MWRDPSLSNPTPYTLNPKQRRRAHGRSMQTVEDSTRMVIIDHGGGSAVTCVVEDMAGQWRRIGGIDGPWMGTYIVGSQDQHNGLYRCSWWAVLVLTRWSIFRWW